jgi:hypothetical protein
MVLYPRYHTSARYGPYELRRLRPHSSFLHTSIDGRWEFQTNGQGFRDRREYAYDKAPGVFRVISLGDSHTQGFECRQDHTFSEVLERTLLRVGIKAEVMNTGISGFSTAEELAFLEAEGLKYGPDAVVLGFFANDLEDNLKSGLYAVDDAGLVIRSRKHVPGVWVLDVLNALPLIRWASEHSYLYSAFMNTAWDHAKAALLSDAQARVQTEFAVPREQASSYAESLGIKLVERMHELCRAREIPLVLLDVPKLDHENVFRSSIPPEMLAPMQASSDLFVSSEAVLGPYRGLTEIHVPGGQRHISEFAHLMLGKAVGEALAETRGDAAADRARGRP